MGGLEGCGDGETRGPRQQARGRGAEVRGQGKRQRARIKCGPGPGRSPPHSWSSSRSGRASCLGGFGGVVGWLVGWVGGWVEKRRREACVWMGGCAGQGRRACLLTGVGPGVHVGPVVGGVPFWGVGWGWGLRGGDGGRVCAFAGATRAQQSSAADPGDPRGACTVPPAPQTPQCPLIAWWCCS